MIIGLVGEKVGIAVQISRRFTIDCLIYDE